MALPYTRAGSFTRSAGVWDALAKQAKAINLKSVKKVEFTFDPFGDNVVSVRNTISYFHVEKVRDTNAKCVLKTRVVCDRTDPTINITLENGHRILFKTKSLTALEILKKYNELVSSKVKEEEQRAQPDTPAKGKVARRK